MAFDTFDRPVPGESLTQALENNAFTKPPKIDNVYDAFYSITEGIEKDQDLYSDMINMIDAGVDLETLCNVCTFGAFSKGAFTPDVAMQLNPLLLLWFYAQADENGILEDDIKIMNFPEKKSLGNMSQEDIVDLMQRKNPEKLKRIQSEGAGEELEQFFAELESMQRGGEAMPVEEEQGSFMTMQQPMDSPVPIAEEGEAV